jgi:hypothetical protein
MIAVRGFEGALRKEGTRRLGQQEDGLAVWK